MSREKLDIEKLKLKGLDYPQKELAVSLCLWQRLGTSV